MRPEARVGRRVSSDEPIWLSSKRTLRKLPEDVMLVVLARCDGLRMVCDECEELRESERDSMVVLAPSSSRKPVVDGLLGDPDCILASLPSRVLEDRLRIGRGLASACKLSAEPTECELLASVSS